MTIKQLNGPGENLKTIIHGKNTVSIVCLFFTKMSIEVMGDFWENFDTGRTFSTTQGYHNLIIQVCRLLYFLETSKHTFCVIFSSLMSKKLGRYHYVISTCH